MPTGHFSTEAVRRAVVDVRHLLWFRAATVRRKRAARVAGVTFLILTGAVAVVPAYLPGAGELGDGTHAVHFLVLLPSALAALLVLAVVSAVATGGGRELLAQEHAVSYPVSPTTDHLGALLLAPLNIAWLLQIWTLLGATAYVLGPHWLLGTQLLAMLWVTTAITLAQIVAWSVEAVRRSEHGQAVVRALGVTVGVLAVWLQLSGNLTVVLDRLPTTLVMLGMVAAREGEALRMVLTGAALLGLTAVAAAVGAVPAHLAARRTARDVVRAETGVRPARRMPRSDLLALVRIDRASVWRAVPTRRGLMVLAVGPGLVALA
ncbi:MAG TPA: hypothetical protein PLP61_10880, partial [Nocardioides sp.]|uniref:hypothetical protein n=1 Tax=Nocardioides sp. TaxID=35761 RepID=UPI002BE2DDCC